MRNYLLLLTAILFIFSCNSDDDETQTFTDSLVGVHLGILEEIQCSLPTEVTSSVNSSTEIFKNSETEVSFNVTSDSGLELDFMGVVNPDSTITISRFSANMDFFSGTANVSSGKLNIFLGDDCLIFDEIIAELIFSEN